MAEPNILCDTKGMTRERWLECRKHGPKGDIPYTVGGSDVAAIFGLSPWMTPLELWMAKKDRIKFFPKLNEDQLEMGHLLEPIVAHMFAKKTGYTVKDDTFMYQHADYPYALADVDRVYYVPGSPDERILECKSTSYHKAKAWADGMYPIYYDLQLRFYLSVKDRRHGAFGALWGNNPDNDFACPEIERDRAKEDIIFEKLDWWIWSLKNDKPPSVRDCNPKIALDALAKVYKDNPLLPTIEFSNKFEPNMRAILDLEGKVAEHRAEVKKLEEEIERRSIVIAEAMKEHQRGVLETTDDKLLIDYVTKTSKRVDTAKLKKDHTAIYESILKTSESRKVKISVQPK